MAFFRRRPRFDAKRSHFKVRPKKRRQRRLGLESLELRTLLTVGGPVILGGDDLTDHGHLDAPVIVDVPGTGNTVVETEVNNSAATADPVTIGDDFSAAMGTSGDADYLSFAGVGGQTIRASALLGTLADSSLTLFDTDGTTELATGDVSSPIEFTLPATGTYFLRATSAGTAPGPGTGNTVAETEVNDTAATADPILIGDDFTGDIAAASNPDYISFSATAGQSFFASTTLGTLSDSTLTLYDTDGITQLAFDDDGGDGLASQISFVAPATGTYFLAVKGFSSATGTYTLQLRPAAGGTGTYSIELRERLLTFTAPKPGTGNTVAETEVNDTAAAANPIVVGDDYTGDIAASGNADYVSFSAVAGQVVVATTELDTLGDSTLALYDTDGTTLLDSDDDGGGGLASKISFVVPATGTYFLAVEGLGGDTGTYKLELRESTSSPTPSLGNLHEGWQYIERALENIASAVTRPGHDGSVVVLGSSDSTADSADAGAAYHWTVPLAAPLTSNLSGVVRFFDGGAAIEQFFTDLAAGNINPAIIVTAGAGSSNDLDAEDGAALTANAFGIANFVNSGGGLLSHGDEVDISYGWLAALLPGVTAPALLDETGLELTPDGLAAFPGITNDDVNAGPFHNYFEPQGAFNSFLNVLAIKPDRFDIDGNPIAVIIGGVVSLPGSITLAPTTETHLVGLNHTVTATTLEEGNPPVAPPTGTVVNFRVTAGPNAGVTGTSVTDVNGAASFTYAGSGGAGTDQVQADYVDSKNNAWISNTVEVVWQALPEIHGFKWDDQNGDGVWDAAEPGLDGWVIQLLLDGQVVAQKTTGDDPGTVDVEVGAYGFTQLNPGTYIVREVLQDGWQQTFPASGGEYQFVLAADQVVTGDFGTAEPPNFSNQLIPLLLGEIHGSKFSDDDGDGVWDTNEPGLDGWTIELLQNGQVITSTVTGDDPATSETEVGAYKFSGLAAGTYTVREVLQNGWQQTFPAGTGEHLVLVTGGQAVGSTGNLLVNGGFEVPTVIGLDDNFGNGSTAITGWTVSGGNVDVNTSGSSVLGDAHSGLQMLDITGSPGAGILDQSFATVPGQSYFLSLHYSNNPNPSFSQQSYSASITVLGNATLLSETVVHGGATQADMNWQPLERTFVADSTTTTLRLQGLDGNFNGIYFDSVSVEGTTQQATFDFGNQLIPPPDPAEIHGFKWNDQNGDGVWDAGEPGLDGWTIELLRDGQVIASTVTGDDPSTPEVEVGSYQFTGLDGATLIAQNSIVASTTLPGLAGLSSSVALSQISDGITCETVSPNGFISSANSGTISLDLVGDYDLESFLLWNDVNLRGEGIRDFRLEFFDAAGAKIDPGFAADFTAPILQAGPEEFAFDGKVSGVSRVDLVVLNCYRGPFLNRIEIPEVAFSGLAAGTYTIREVPQDGWQQTFPGAGAEHQVSLSPGQIVAGAFGTAESPNFGNQLIPVPLSEIHGSKFNDLDGDGVWDTEEPGLDGWTIELLQDGQVIESTVTGDDPSTPETEVGAYSFTGLAAGTYTVREVQQQGWQQTFPGGGTYTIDLGISSVATVKNIATGFNDATGEKYTLDTSDTDYVIAAGGTGGHVGAVPLVKRGTFPASYEPDNSSAGSAWLLLAGGGGSQSEVPQGTYFFQTQVDATGFDHSTLQIAGLRGAADDTIVSVYVNDVLVFSPVPGTSGHQFVSFGDVGLGAFQAGINTITFEVANIPVPNTDMGLRVEGLVQGTTLAAETRTDINFGNQLLPPPATAEIHGIKWNDLDGDGDWEEEEPVLNGWTIQLLRDGQVIATTVTGDDPTTPITEEGAYAFLGLEAGNYTVREVLQDGWRCIFPGPSGEHNVVLADGQIVSGMFPVVEIPNFGNQLTPPTADAEIHGYKWNDLDGDGVWDEQEPGIDGWTIELVQDGQVIASTVTGDDPSTQEIEVGAYVFTGLEAGNYTVREVVQNGWQQTFPVGSGAHDMVLAASEILAGAFGVAESPNFGNQLIPPPTDAQISGYKWNDLDGDGVWDEQEPGIDGWTIELVQDGQVIASTETGDDPSTQEIEVGAYVFTGLEAGNYTVREVVQNGWQQTFPVGSGAHDVVLAASEILAGAFGVAESPNFGNQLTPPPTDAQISGYKWNDLDGDGCWDAGESGLDGWTIELVVDCQVVATTVTGDDPSTLEVEVGFYQFTGLEAGTYTVREVLEFGWRQTYPGCSGEHIVTLTSGEVVSGTSGVAEPPNFGNQLIPPRHGKGNNGVGNGIDPPPPGNPPVNDGPGTSPGNPGNRGGANGNGNGNGWGQGNGGKANKFNSSGLHNAPMVFHTAKKFSLGNSKPVELMPALVDALMAQLGQ